MPEKTFLTATREAGLCSDNCLECSINSTYCSKCVPWLHLSASNMTCSPCGASYFVSSDSRCYRCPNQCLECTNSSECTKCVPGLYKDAVTSQCVVCGSGKTVTFDQKCKACNPNCATCESSISHCTSCTSALQFVSSTNLTCSACGSGFFVNPIDGRCYPCDSNCLTCKDRA